MNPVEFAMMGEVVHRSGHRLYLYKHHVTRRYLNIDAAGHAFRYRGEADVDEMTSWYAPHGSVTDAVEHLELRLIEESGMWLTVPTHR